MCCAVALSGPMDTNATLQCWRWVQAALQLVPAKAMVGSLQLIVFSRRIFFFQFSDQVFLIL